MEACCWQVQAPECLSGTYVPVPGPLVILTELTQREIAALLPRGPVFKGVMTTQSLLPPIRGIVLNDSEANFKMNEKNSSSPFLVGSLWDVLIGGVC